VIATIRRGDRPASRGDRPVSRPGGAFLELEPAAARRNGCGNNRRLGNGRWARADRGTDNCGLGDGWWTGAGDGSDYCDLGDGATYDAASGATWS